MNFCKNIILALLLFFLMNVGVMAGDANSAASKSNNAKSNAMKNNTSSITIPSELFERLLDDYEPETVADLFDYLSIDPEEQRKIYPAYQVAERAAKEKQRALSAPGAGKIVMKVGDSLAINGLDEQAIDACVAVFSKNLQIAISNNTRKVLCCWARRRLKSDFMETFTIQLQKNVITMSPDGKTGFGSGPASTTDLALTPPHLSGYYFRIYRLIDGKPAAGTETGFPYQTLEGQRYDFLTIVTGEEATKPVEEKSKKTPNKEKSR